MASRSSRTSFALCQNLTEQPQANTAQIGAVVPYATLRFLKCMYTSAPVLMSISNVKCGDYTISSHTTHMLLHLQQTLNTAAILRYM